MLLSQLPCTLLYFVDLADFSQLQHIQPSPAVNQNPRALCSPCSETLLIRLLRIRGRAGWTGAILLGDFLGWGFWGWGLSRLAALWASITHSQCKPGRKQWIRAQGLQGGRFRGPDGVGHDLGRLEHSPLFFSLCDTRAAAGRM